MSFKLTKDQAKVATLIETTSSNYCLLGGPGTGKTVLIKWLDTEGKKKYTLTAPTGMAAVNMDNGRTIQSLLNIPSGCIPPNYNKYPSHPAAIANIKYNVRHLIIDEVSMLRVDALDYINRCLQFIKKSHQPFGGVQIILVGDFFQLPPVVKDDEAPLLEEDGWDHPYAFGHPLFKEFKVVQLKQVLRQAKDKAFINILEQVRRGAISANSLKLLNKQVRPLTEMCIQLVATNRRCDEINAENLRKIKKKTVEYHADSYGWNEVYPVDTVIELKVGATVLVKRNGADIENGRPRGIGDSLIVNGTIGKVHSLGEDHITITVKKKNYKIFRARWEKKKRDLVDGKWVETVVATYEQLPIRLAYAISMHKSQGSTFDRAHIDPARIFTDGQLYVAITRCRTLKGMTFERTVFPHFFRINKHVQQFYNKLK